jgi:NAD(P)-dependent dehydrogenase (short-subunit alcohol dehydrogenase family)
MGRLSGKVAIVTGGARAGMGAASSRRLAADGAAVVIADIDEGGGHQLEVELTAARLVASFHRCDVTNAPDLDGVVAYAVERYGRLDVMHNHAVGPFSRGYLSEISVEDWDRSLRNVLSSVFYGCRAAIPAMIESGGGSIVNTSSSAGLGSQRTNGIYSTAKAGVMVLSQCVAWEYGSVGIRCNAIAPGITGERVVRIMEETGGYPNRAALLAQHASGRAVEPDEVAALVSFLASDEASAISGMTISVDGGANARAGDFLGLGPYPLNG